VFSGCVFQFCNKGHILGKTSAANTSGPRLSVWKRVQNWEIWSKGVVLVTRWTYGDVLWVIGIIEERRICGANYPDHQARFGGKFESQRQRIWKLAFFYKLPFWNLCLLLQSNKSWIDGNILFLHVLASSCEFLRRFCWISSWRVQAWQRISRRSCTSNERILVLYPSKERVEFSLSEKPIPTILPCVVIEILNFARWFFADFESRRLCDSNFPPKCPWWSG